MKSIFKKSIIVAAFLFGAVGISNAQVKIGTNPTTIEATSNLEVEASTAGRKVKVDKTTGQMTIADGTQGNGKVLTSDANGGASWQNGGANCGSFEATRSTAQTVDILNNSTPPTTLVATNEVFDPLNAYDASTGSYTVPATGYYSFSGAAVDIIDGAYNATRHSTLALVVAKQATAPTVLSRSVQQAEPYGYGTWNNVSCLTYLTAGDVITLRHLVQHVSGTQPGPTINVSEIKFSGTRVDCDKN
jgi:hypothetical protein